MSKISKLSLPIILLLIGSNVFSQYYVKTKGDSLAFEADSIVLTIDNLPGIINWEVSSDSLTWESINNYNDTMWVRIDSSAYYRAVLMDGTCYPVESSVALVGFKSIQVSGNSITIDSLGGVFSFSSGIKIIVPPGAVKEGVTFLLDLLNSDQANISIPLDAFPGKEFSAGLYCDPSEIQFLKPVRVRVPTLNYQNTDIPFVYMYNTMSNTWSQHTGTLTCSENEQFIEYSTDALFSTRIELIKDVFTFSKSSLKSNEKEYDCHDLLNKVRTEAYEYIGQIGNNTCHVVNENLRIEFPLCDGSPVGTAHIQEIGEFCEPLAIPSIDKKCLANQESATLTVNVSIGGMPLEQQQVYIELPAGLSTGNTLMLTDHAGNAKFNIKCNVENLGISQITYYVHTQYYLEIINASADGETEITKNYQKTSEISGTQSVGCSPIKRVEIEGSKYKFKRGETDQITCNCFDKDGNQVDCGEVLYSIAPGSSYPAEGAVSVNPVSGVVTAIKPGVARIQAMASGVESKYSIPYTVAYEGDLSFEDVTSHISQYGWCGCAEDYDNPLTNYAISMYVVRYTVDLHLYFWLGSDLKFTPSGDLEGQNSYTYTIAPESLCKNAVWFEVVDGHVPWDPFSYQTTQGIISGAEFYTNYQYYDYRGEAYGNVISLLLKCKLINEEISAEVDFYWLHGCVGNLGKVHPKGFIMR